MVTADLSRQKVITLQAHAGATLLYAFGTLIGNSDMHAGNLSFVSASVSDQGRPYALSPAYDMLPMVFSPAAGGVIRDTVPAAHLHPTVDGDTWRAAQVLSAQYLTRLSDDARLSDSFRPCINAIRAHMEDAAQRIGRLG